VRHSKNGPPTATNGMVRPCSAPASMESWPRGTEDKEHRNVTVSSCQVNCQPPSAPFLPTLNT
jgi:hypothetical protein